MTARVGAVHLGWDVVTVAAGGGGKPIRPVQVESTYTPPAYLLADSSGRLHTAGVDRRPDVGIAISDVRDIIGHPRIVIAGATWPAELVFRARLFNPLAAIGKHLGGAPDVVALPFPDDWPDEKVDEYARLVEQLGVAVEPLPESVALSGYVRALGLVRAEPSVGATGVYSDGRGCLVVAVHGDDEEPTESMGVGIHPDALHDARAADNVVIEVMAAARTIGADTSTVLLTGNVAFNDALRLAFQNHLGHRLQVADHPMHAMVLGATHLLVNDSENYPEDAPYAGAGQPHPGAGQPPAPHAGRPQPGQAPPAPGQAHAGAGQPSPAPGQPPSATGASQSGAAQSYSGAPQQASGAGAEADAARQGGPRHSSPGSQVPPAAARSVDPVPRQIPSSGQPQPQTPASMQPLQRQPEPLRQQPEMTPRHMDSPPSGESAGQSATGAPASPTDPAGQTRRISQEEIAALAAQGMAAGQGAGTGDVPIASQSSRNLPAGAPGMGSRFTRPPGTPADDQATAVVGRPPQGAASAGGQGYSGYGPHGPGNTPAGHEHSSQGGSGQGAAGQGGVGQYGPSGTGAHAYSPQSPGQPYGQGGSGYSTGPQGVVGGYGPGGPTPGGGYGAAQGGHGGEGGYGPAGQPGGYASGPGGSSAGNPAGQGGSGYAGPVPPTGSPSPYPPSRDTDADRSDQDSGEGESKRKGLWNKMKGKR
ncbi:hypothetical protein [Nocardia sp. NPDC050406]|uniref:hypothetical protein n=1 Tax=Nocardia sp. NPDC050406 TaxID=3364318 RepID=UPI0037AB3B1D